MLKHDTVWKVCLASWAHLAWRSRVLALEQNNSTQILPVPSQLMLDKFLAVSCLSFLLWKTERLSVSASQAVVKAKWENVCKALGTVPGVFSKLWSIAHDRLWLCCIWRLGVKQWPCKEEFQCCGAEEPPPDLKEQREHYQELPRIGTDGVFHRWMVGMLKGADTLQNCLAVSIKAEHTATPWPDLHTYQNVFLTEISAYMHQKT